MRDLADAAVHVRLAGPADAARIGAVHVQAWRESYVGLLPDAAIAEWTPADRAGMWGQVIAQGVARGVYVAEVGGSVIGFGACADQRSDALKAQGYGGEVTALYVLRIAQRRGAGRLLMGAMTRRLIAEGDRTMALWVLSANAPARRFYERMGGVKVAHRGGSPPPFDDSETAYGWHDLTELAARR